MSCALDIIENQGVSEPPLNAQVGYRLVAPTNHEIALFLFPVVRELH